MALVNGDSRMHQSTSKRIMGVVSAGFARFLRQGCAVIRGISVSCRRKDNACVVMAGRCKEQTRKLLVEARKKTGPNEGTRSAACFTLEPRQIRRGQIRPKTAGRKCFARNKQSCAGGYRFEVPIENNLMTGRTWVCVELEFINQAFGSPQASTRAPFRAISAAQNECGVGNLGAFITVVAPGHWRVGGGGVFGGHQCK